MNPLSQQTRWFWICTILCTVGVACSTAPTASKTEEPLALTLSPDTTRALAAPATPPTDIEIEISYVLGHDQYRFRASAKKGYFEAKSFLNHKVLKSTSRLDPKGFEAWVAKVQTYVEERSKLAAPTRLPAVAANTCRSPYWLTVKTSLGSKTVEGCRSAQQDSVHFSRISREGDFLLYSGK